MYDVDKIKVFSDIINNLENEEYERVKNERKLQERKNRENFRDLLWDMIYQN